MPRKTHGTHPDHTRTSSSKPVPADQKDDAPTAHLSHWQNPLDEALSGFPTLLGTLLQRDDGWLRVVPDGDGKLVWWKWKFTHGRHAGSYVMVRGERDQHAESLELLCRKLQQVDVGASRPTKDKYYDQG